MKRLENMSLEELIEFDNKHKVLSFEDARALKILNIIARKNKYSRKDYDMYREKLPIRIELERLYDELLYDLLCEIEESSFDKDPLTLCILVGSCLIPNGLLSYTQNFHSITSVDQVKQVFNEDPDFYTRRYAEIGGIYTIAGFGCCRHVNSFVSDLLRKKGINSDKITCLRTNTELELMERQGSTNHVITGYIDNDKYHMVDCYNKIYTYQKQGDFYYNKSNYVIPDFSYPLLQQYPFYYNPNIAYESFDSKEIEERVSKIQFLFNEKEYQRFLKFKQEHFELYKKIAYLIPIELERTEEKEKQKLKRMK